MAYIALYRKYRPKTFSEVVNQEHVKRTLMNALKLDKVSHAYLFCGQRGIGKTTIARILAKAVNCTNRKEAEPCNKCDACQEIIQGRSLDLVEIDAASTRGIDEIRELREKIKFSPTRLKYKVFIIDEVHMLTMEAFNALLKTLEEPPAHAIFALCTTAPHKIPATILSRCQRFDFKKIGQKDIVEHLDAIAKKEKVKIDKEALELIASNSSGSDRDALSLLAQVIAYEDKHITLEEVKSILGIPDLRAAMDLVEFLAQGKSAEAVRLVNEVNQSGYDLVQFVKNIIEYLRQILLLKIDKHMVSSLDKEQQEKALAWAKLLKDEQILNWIELFNGARRNITSSVLPQLPLELACVEATQSAVSKQQTADSKRRVIDNNQGSVNNKPSNVAQTFRSDKQRAKSNKPQTTLTIQQIHQKWSDFLAEVSSQNHGLIILLKSAEPQKLEKNQLILACEHDFHKERIQDHKNIELLERLLKQIYGSKLIIRCVSKEDLPKQDQNKKQNSKLLDSALKVFGGKVVE